MKGLPRWWPPVVAGGGVAGMIGALAWCGTLSAQASPGTGAELVGQGTVSGDRDVAFPAFSSNGFTLYFSRSKPGGEWSDQELMASDWVDGAWGDPRPLPFSGGTASDRAPRMVPQGRSQGRWLIFTSNRPLPEDSSRTDYNLWVARRDRAGHWYGPVPLAGRVNSGADDIHASMADDGTMVFSSNRPGGLGRGDVWRTRLVEDRFLTPVNLGPPVNDTLSQSDAWLSPDGSLMILVVTDRPGGLGGDDLWWSRRQDDRWSEPRNLGARVNTPACEYGPTVSPDGEWLYFTSDRSGTGAIYRISLAEVVGYPD